MVTRTGDGVVVVEEEDEKDAIARNVYTALSMQLRGP